MRLSPWAFAPFITTVYAATLHVNYYSDGGCENWLTDVYPSVDWTCYGYDWTGTNSVNIADCTFPNGDCVCTFWTQSGCTGASQTVVYGQSGNCASNWGHGFVSMQCGIIHDLKA
jgi:hypothetical protein